jgi:hypothetical protein
MNRFAPEATEGPMPKAGKSRAKSSAGAVQAISRLVESARSGELVAVVGTGVSLALTDGKNRALSWKGLILDGFGRARDLGRITKTQFDHWQSQRDSDDLDDLLAAAEFIGRKLEAPSGDLYARWLKDVFRDVTATNQRVVSAVQTLHSVNIPIATLNYDSLLEGVTDLASIRLDETSKVIEWIRREREGVLHLHGSWEAPATCILGIRDYQATLGNEVRDLIQRSLGAFKRLLFIGCGDTFADPNFCSLIRWLRIQLGSAAPEHYALVIDGDLAARKADPTWAGFVEPLSYGASRERLADFLTSTFGSLSRFELGQKPRDGDAPPATSAAKDVLDSYAAFLLKDCGQMTIEGVRADMDTAQRRFDLEKLFVPINLLPTPPDIPFNDPEREAKLMLWKQKNSKPEPFGRVFNTTPKLVLLALPGGGKSMLLKRIAVAYADPKRRTASQDGLPNLKITPVVIRCREWREHIHRPIVTLLKNFAEVTGQLSLDGLYGALEPMLRSGRVLLLVDGLDEIHDDALRLTFVEHLEKFLDQFPKIRLVVTSREAGFSLVAPSLVRFCERYRIAPLDSRGIRSLCDHWHRLMTGDSLESSVCFR